MSVSIKLAGLATVLACLASGCETHDFVTFKQVTGDTVDMLNPMSGDPSFVNDANRPFEYLYYPATQVYYSVEEDMFYWPSTSGWESGYRLPREFAFTHAPYENVMLSSNRPYFHHPEVEELYPADDFVLIQITDVASVPTNRP